METDYINLIFEGFIDIYHNPRNAIMWLIAGFLMYFGIAKKKEPLLLVPISFGVLLANFWIFNLFFEFSIFYYPSTEEK